MLWTGAFISPIMKWANVLKEPSKKKKSPKLNAASHNNTSWYTDIDGFLEHSLRGGSLYYKRPTLQKIILFFWVLPGRLDSVGFGMIAFDSLKQIP